MGHNPSRMTHSACWAVRRFATELGEEISEALLFGVGRTAWYCFRSEDQHPVLLTYHPLRVSRMFLALNVPTEVYRCWTDKPLTPDALSGCDGKTLLLEVDKSIFDADDTNEFDAGTPRDYCVWTSRLIQQSTAEGGWPLVELRVPHSDNPVTLDGSLLASGWRTLAKEVAAYTFYLPYTATILWNRQVQIRLAIQQWIHQMRQTASPYGLGGLEALPAFADSLENHAADIEQTRRYAFMDGGQAGHRDLLSEFFAEAAEILQDPVLSEAAIAYANIASAWRGVLTGTARGADCASVIRDVYALECEEVQRLEEAFIS